MAGVDTKGQVVWKKQIFSGDNDGVSTSPVVSGNQVYVTAGFGGGCHLFDIDKKMEATDKYKKTIQKKLKNTHGGVVLIDGHIYGHTEPGAWICQDLATGEDKWLERNDLKCQSGAIIAAEGNLYLFTDDGEVALAPASPAAFNITSSFKLPKRSKVPMDRTTSRQSRVWAHPAICDGGLYLRDHENIFAFKIK